MDLPRLWPPSAFVLGYGQADPSGSPLLHTRLSSHSAVASSWEDSYFDLMFPLVVVMGGTVTPTPWGTFPLMNVAVISETSTGRRVAAKARTR